MSTLSKFPTSTGANSYFKRDNTLRILTGDLQTPAYAATIALTITSNDTLVQPATLTGAVTFTANVGTGLADDGAPFLGDCLQFLLISDGTTRTATFGTGFAVNGTFAVTTGKYGSIQFIFNGALWVELSRTITA